MWKVDSSRHTTKNASSDEEVLKKVHSIFSSLQFGRTANSRKNPASDTSDTLLQERFTNEDDDQKKTRA